MTALEAIDSLESVLAKQASLSVISLRKVELKCIIDALLGGDKTPPSAKRWALKNIEENLTDRERRILILLAYGYSLLDVGAALNMTPKKVREYTARLYTALFVDNKTKAALYALKSGFVDLEQITTADLTCQCKLCSKLRIEAVLGYSLDSPMTCDEETVIWN